MRPLFTLIALLGTAATTMAQTPEVIAEVESLLQSQRQSVDVEVLRRLLNRQFGFADKAEMQLPPPQTWYPLNTTGGTNPTFLGSGVFNLPLTATVVPSHQLSQPIGPFDGTALPGGGIVFTLHIPAGADLTLDPKTNAIGFGNNCGKCHADVAADGPNHQLSHKGQALALACTKCHEGGVSGKDLKAVAPRSDWERTKLEVAVEKVEELEKPQPKPAAPRSAMCRPGDIGEEIFQVLAVNAKNIGEGQLPNKPLAKTDRVTVVVTFDELPRQSGETLDPTSKPGFNPDELQSLNLAGLHMKQQKYKEAAEAYEKGLARFQETVIRMSVISGASLEAFRKAMDESAESTRGMHRQLAVAYANLGDLKKASRALDLAINLKLEILAAKATEKPKPKLPAKIIVSVTKADIDSAKTSDEFRKVATVERSGFPAPKK